MWLLFSLAQEHNIYIKRDYQIIITFFGLQFALKMWPVKRSFIINHFSLTLSSLITDMLTHGLNMWVRGGKQMLTVSILFHLPIGMTWAPTDLPHQPAPAQLNSESLWNHQSSSSLPGSSSTGPSRPVWQTSPQQKCLWKPVDPHRIPHVIIHNWTYTYYNFPTKV